jgi:trk system potassium uptake protein TrkA
MKIVIIGAGFTGIQLAKRLIEEHNDVVLIDNNEDIARHAGNRLDCTVIQADGNNLENLENAGIAKANALVCVTNSDEINMITCSLVDAVYPNLLKIARVRNYAYYVNTNAARKHHAETFVGDHRPLYGIDFMIHPDVEAAEAIVSAVAHGAVTDVLTFGKSEYELTRVQIEPMSKMDGIEVKNIRTLTNRKFIVVYVESKDCSTLPSGNTVIHAGDSVGILTQKENVPTILELCGSKIEELKKVALVGAGRIGTIVADRIIEKRTTSLFGKFFEKAHKRIAQDFVIIDSDEELCKQAIERFPNANVFCADITDEGFIQEEGLDKFNLVICATHNHELNMVVSAYIESLGVEKTIALVANSAFGEIARKLGVDVTVPIRDSVVDSIMSHLRGKSVTGVHTVSSGDMEIIECELPSSSKVVGKTLKDISSPGEYLVLLIKKTGSEQYDIPVGNTILTVGDHLVLIASTANQKVLEKFSGKK